ncbi:hypothetical protein [Reyranella sp. CPCC 100927]|uniref:hypothetical protein n=1 Tax=Reyranella sp. CPCC 100927 TaxID=2599616 RepID=UPI0011B58E65|nr:hypothetical protein [Reyranella sp. CPCC 100927]TWT14928.1 hypothetical protein FQU96_00740 [Reyranella sp. CPCC 100927]
MAIRGWAKFAWQADYGQFYLIDGDDPAFQAPTEITAEMERRSLAVPAAGLVIYTHDCLQQHIRIAIHDSEPDHAPVEAMSGKPWTRVETAQACFPSRRFTISSPSAPHPLPGGPVFFLDAATVTARISWMEFQGSRDDSVPVEPDVIEIALWAPR